jgi:hypothetical protein
LIVELDGAKKFVFIPVIAELERPRKPDKGLRIPGWR